VFNIELFCRFGTLVRCTDKGTYNMAAALQWSAVLRRDRSCQIALGDRDGFLL